MKLLSLLADYPVISISGKLPERITGFSSDSRQIKPGFLFVCIRGETADGHQFVQDAVLRGAAVIVCEEGAAAKCAQLIVTDTRHFLSFFADRYYKEPSSSVKVTGITGTNGKTTTAHFLYEIYQAAGSKSALMGTVGLKRSGHYRSQSLTTPGSEELHKTLWQLKQDGYHHVAMEVSSHALVQKRVEHCRFHIAIFTNLTREHLDYHQTMENYFQAKAHLFDLLSPAGTAVINKDDPYATSLCNRIVVPVIGYSMKHPSDVMVKKIHPLADGSSFVNISSAWGEFTFRLRMHGNYNIYNALAASASALADNIALEHIIRGVEALQCVPGRLEKLQTSPGITVYLDYAHTPDGLLNVLQTLNEDPHRRIILVFGCRGRRDQGKRPQMGIIAEHYADLVVLTSDNPQNEDPQQIATDISSAMQTKPVFIADRQTAIHFALSQAEQGDIVLITGKGREEYQLIDNYILTYSDNNVVASYFQEHPH